MCAACFGLYLSRHPQTYQYKNLRNEDMIKSTVPLIYSGPGSSVGVATEYGLDGLRSNSGGDEIFRPSRPALGPTQPPVQWVPGLSRRYSAAGACC